MKAIKKCNGDYPEWEAKEELWWVSFNAPDICYQCDFIMTCTLQRSTMILDDETLPPSDKEAEIIATTFKAMSEHGSWDIPNDLWEQIQWMHETKH